ncbi:hypothetical protein V5O48_003681 [Marasmius crinis-equi]|uniref:Uncharacterized protein n=1 Tax=Marasmius crinis-equi TaxID=585013 RepID=A0ABR3FSD7_9AGAR
MASSSLDVTYATVLAARRELVEQHRCHYLPRTNFASLHWSPRDDLDMPTFVIYKDYHQVQCALEREICAHEAAFLRELRGFIDDEAEESNSVGSHEGESDVEEEESLDEQSVQCDDEEGNAAVMVLLAKTQADAERQNTGVLVLESIIDHPILKDDFAIAVAILRDLCDLQSTTGWATEGVVIENRSSDALYHQTVAVQSPVISCLPGTLVEVGFTLRREVVPIVRREIFLAELLYIRVLSSPPCTPGRSCGMDESEGGLQTGRGVKRARLG